MTAPAELAQKREKLLQRVRQIIEGRYGHDDELKIPDGLHVEERPWGKIISQLDPTTRQPIPPTNGLFVVVHGGIDLPVKIAGDNLEQIINLSDDDAIENLAQSIADNKDVGVGAITTAYLEGMVNGLYNNVAVVWVDPSRVVGDYNRNVFEEQFPTKQYKGESPFVGPITKDRFSDLHKGIMSFVEDVRALALSAQTMVAVALHSYDKKSAGANTIASQYQVEGQGSDDATAAQRMRPHIHLFKEFADPDRPELITEEQCNWLLSLAHHYLNLILHEDESAEVGVDTVYTAFQMPVTKLVEEILGFILVFIEIRKDLLDVTDYVSGSARQAELGRRSSAFAQMLQQVMVGVGNPAQRAPLGNHAY
jgi:hypothetical protein